MRLIQSIKKFFSESPEPSAPVPHKNRRFLAAYSLALFAVFFALILLSMFVNERNNRLELDQYKTEQDKSVISAMESLENMQRENKALKETVSVLNSGLDKLIQDKQDISKASKEKLDAAAAELAALKASNEKLEKTRQAEELLWQLQKLYYEKKYTASNKIIDHMEENGLSAFLPDKATQDFTVLSPLEAYNRIKDKLD